MIDMFAKTAATIAREMYAAGARGASLDEAVAAAIDLVPALPVKPVIAKHLRRAFEE